MRAGKDFKSLPLNYGFVIRFAGGQAGRIKNPAFVKKSAQWGLGEHRLSNLSLFLQKNKIMSTRKPTGKPTQIKLDFD